MAGYPGATLGDKIILASTPVRWAFTEGVRPHEESFDLVLTDALALVADAKPVTLKYQVDGIVYEVKNLWVMHVGPSDVPSIGRVRVADRRWTLPYGITLRRYNMHRNVGHKRVGQNANPQLRPVVPDVWYAKYSLKEPDALPPTAKWQPHQTVEDVLKHLDEEDKEVGLNAGFTIHGSIKNLDRKLPIENLVVDDSNDTSLARVLAALPEAGITVNREGQYVVFLRTTGAEVQAVKDLGPVQMGTGQLVMIANKAVRPRRIEVYFTVEAELALDYIEIAEGIEHAAPGVTRGMENIVSVPEYSLTLNGEVVPQGSWVELDSILRAWGAPPSQGGIGVGGSYLTRKVIEKAQLPYLDLWSAVLLMGLRNPDQDWAGRVSAINQCWRKIFRVNPRVTDGVLTFKACRVGLVDPISGSSGKAEAYCDHSFLGTQRSYFKDVQSNANMSFCINVDGYPTGGEVPGASNVPGAQALDEDSRPAPADVTILNSDMGIIRVELLPDINHMHEAALPGKIVRTDEAEFPPTFDARNPRGEAPIGFNLVTSAQQVPKLSSNWKLKVILTAVPAAPNDERQLYKVVVKPEDVKDMLPESAQAGLSSASGPVWKVRVNGGQNGARALVRWLDSRAADIEALFGLSDKKPDLTDLVMNAELVNKKGDQAPSLNSIARSIGAKIYSSFADHIQGSGKAMVNRNIEIGGWLDEVSVELDQNGVITTGLRVKEQLPGIDFAAFLDSGTRAILFREVQPK